MRRTYQNKPVAYRGHGVDGTKRYPNQRGYVSKSLRADDAANENSLRYYLASRGRDPEAYLDKRGKR